MKQKYLTETYLRGVSNYEIHIVKEESTNAYLCAKKIIEIDIPYIETHTKKNTCLLDNGYYILEYLPLEEHYAIRYFFNAAFEVQQIYIDITKRNGYEHHSPFYLDLYLDITIEVPADNQVMIWDEEELQGAFQNGDITAEDVQLAHDVCNTLLEEIKNNSNPFLQRDNAQTLQWVLSQKKES